MKQMAAAIAAAIAMIAAMYAPADIPAEVTGYGTVECGACGAEVLEAYEVYTMDGEGTCEICRHCLADDEEVIEIHGRWPMQVYTCEKCGRECDEHWWWNYTGTMTVDSLSVVCEECFEQEMEEGR